VVSGTQLMSLPTINKRDETGGLVADTVTLMLLSKEETPGLGPGYDVITAQSSR
jgi:hypothetical protein